MKDRIEDKIVQVEKYLNELLSFKPSNLEEFKNNMEKKAACERYIEKIAEALIDLAVLIIRFGKFESPEDDDKSFQILSKNNIIDSKLAVKLSDLKGMRNRLAHRYEEIDDDLIFKAIDKEIEKDIEEFLTKIKNEISIK